MPLIDGIISYHKFSENSGNALDATGNGHILVNASSAPYVLGKIDNAIDFSGANAGKTLGNTSIANLITGAFSFAFLLNNSEQPSSSTFQKFFLGNAATGVNYVLNYQDSLGTKRLQLIRTRVGISQNIAQVNTTLATGVWNEVIGTYDPALGSNHLKLFLNGTLIAQGSGIGNGGGQADTLVLGGAGGCLNDELAIWGRALTQEEITLRNDGGDILQYPFSFGPSVSRIPSISSIPSIPSIAM